MNYWIIPLIKDRKYVSLPTIAASYEGEEIINVVAKYYGFTKERMCEKDRYRNVCLARQIAMFLMRKHTKLSFKEISSRFGGRDHTTAIHACHHVSDLMETEEIVAEDVRKLKILLNTINVI